MDNWRPGVLNKEQLIDLCSANKISNVATDKIEDPSSLDLHITDDVYQLKGCAKPLANLDIPTLLAHFKEKRLHFEKNNTIILKSKKTYVFRVAESINFDNTDFYGHATGKSTFGRLDILTRLLTSKNDSYDVVQKNYNGSLWIEVTPITFPVKIKVGMSLNQLRVLKGEPSICMINTRELNLWGDLIFDENGEKLPQTENKQLNLTLSLNEDPQIRNSVCAFGAKKMDDDCDPLDLTQDVGNEGYLIESDYWERLKPPEDNPLALEIKPERFYILRSKERFKLPASVAIYCQAVTENLGELRIHYAGFVHPWFGFNRADKKGAPLIFEVRGHNIKAFLQDGETLARLEYYYMSKDAEKHNPSYGNQELTLSKYFKMN